jgi:hypothetical protein
MSVLDDPDIQVKILFRFIPRVCESLHWSVIKWSE